MKKLLSIVVVGFSLLLVACGPATKTFEGSGMKITLTDEFVEKEVIQAVFYLESTQHMFAGNPEDKSLVHNAGADTLDEYIELVLQNANKASAEVLHFEEEGIEFYYAYYENAVSGQEFGYMLICMEGEDNFYSMNFGCRLSNLEGNKAQWLAWAKTITVE